LPVPPVAGQRDQPEAGAPEQRRELGELPLAPEERRRRHGQIGGREALQRRELTRAQLVQPLGRGQVLEPVFAEVVQLGVDQRRRRGRDDHLAAVGRRRDARGPVNIVADVALSGQERRAGVDTDANRDRPARDVARRLERARRRREGEEERVTLRVDLRAAVSRTRLAHEAAVLGQERGIALGAELLQKAGRALDVAEEERDRAARQSVHSTSARNRRVRSSRGAEKNWSGGASSTMRP